MYDAALDVGVGLTCVFKYLNTDIRKKRTGFQGLHSRSVTVRERLPDICRTNRLPRERKVSLNKNNGRERVLLAVVMCVIGKINQNLAGISGIELLTVVQLIK